METSKTMTLDGKVLNSKDHDTPDVKEYTSSLSELHKNALTIAEDHLGSSFDIIKSNGFKNWLKSKNTPSTTST